jgi:hypothetical protein
MKKLLVLIILALALPGFAADKAPVTVTYPLCDFLNTIVFNTDTSGGASYYEPSFFVMYDGRFYSSEFFENIQRPNGGIKFALELGTWPTEANRDAVIGNIKYVEFKNLTKGQTYTLDNADKYIYTPPGRKAHYSADYYMWLGSSYNIIGNWEVRLVTKGKEGKVYFASFTVDQSFLNDIVNQPVEITRLHNNGTNYTACFIPPPEAVGGVYGDQWRFRVVDTAGNVPWDMSRYTFPSTIPPEICWTGIPSIYEGSQYNVRVEVRTVGNGIRLNCAAGTMWPYFSRTNSYFILKEYPVAPPAN